MRPDERALQKLLKADGAKVPIPDEMWSSIAHRLQAERAQRRHRRRLAEAITLQVRPVMAFAAAIAVFWLAVVPLGYLSEQTEPSDTVIARVVAPSRQDFVSDSGPYLTPVQQPVARQVDGAPNAGSFQRGLTLAH